MPQGLATDLSVSLPDLGHVTYTGLQSRSSGLSSTAQVVGVIQKFEWEGGVGNPLKFDFYVSQLNAHQLTTQQQFGLATTKVNALSWWIIDYDQKTKSGTRRWFIKSSSASPQPRALSRTGCALPTPPPNRLINSGDWWLERPITVAEGGARLRFPPEPCNRCHRVVPLDLTAMVARGLGEKPLVELPLRCRACGSRSFGLICLTGHTGPAARSQAVVRGGR